MTLKLLSVVLGLLGSDLYLNNSPQLELTSLQAIKKLLDYKFKN